jgi:Fic family protein
MWIHECPGWPNFQWDYDELAAILAKVRYQQGNLLGKMHEIGFSFKQEASLITLTEDIIKSSAIEGENLNNKEVRSSIVRKLGLDVGGLIPSNRNVDGIVELMLDSTQKFDNPLTKERLFCWHSALFPTGRSGLYKITVGGWRTDHSGSMQVVSGPIGREKVHFEAPAAEKIESEMELFIQWIEAKTDLDPVLKAGIAHLWFVTIHPFEDGNGRIGRSITDMLLARADSSPHRFYSLSSQFELERNDYYNTLEHQQRGELDITLWLKWYLKCVDRALLAGEKSLTDVLYKSKFWEIANKNSINTRQRTILNKMLQGDFLGHINTSKYSKLAKCSPDTALRDIQGLKNMDILIQNEGGGRSTSYRLKKTYNDQLGY